MKETKGYSLLPRTLSNTIHFVPFSGSILKKVHISSDAFLKLTCNSKFLISIPSIFISCEKLNQFFTPPIIPFFTTFVPCPFFLTNNPSNTSLLIAWRSVFLDMFNCSEVSHFCIPLIL